MSLSQSLIASCPEARYISFTPRWALKSYLQIIIDNCPRLEVLEDFTDHFWEADMCKLIVDNLPNLRTIILSPLSSVDPSAIDSLKKLNHLQTIILCWDPPLITYTDEFWHLSRDEQVIRLAKIQEDWIETFKHILIQIQLRDNLEKTLVMRSEKGELTQIRLPKL